MIFDVFYKVTTPTKFKCQSLDLEEIFILTKYSRIPKNLNLMGTKSVFQNSSEESRES